MNRFKVFAAVLASVFLATAVWGQDKPQTNPTVSANDTARFLAGMPVPADSPLAKIAEDPNIKQYAGQLDIAFGSVEKNQLSKIRAWTSANMTGPKPVLFYMFGGPDFLYANVFFPNATTYVLGGLEPVGRIPDITKLPQWSTVQALRNIQGSLRSVLTLSYFITAQMSQDLSSGPVNGTLPILYVFLARSGKTIHSVDLVQLDERGALQPGDDSRVPSPARGVKIIFSESGGPQKTLYYFSTNLEDRRDQNIALLQFCKSLGQGDSFVKSASYLMHGGNFSQVRNFVLENSNTILQDDTGVPARLFDTAQWQIRLFGRYVRPIPIFDSMYQTRMAQLYQALGSKPIDFGVGYRWYPNESNLLMATKDPNAPVVTASVEVSVVPPSQAYRAPSYNTQPTYGPFASASAQPNRPAPDPNGPVSQCWVSTDRDRGFGYTLPTC